MTFIIGIGGGSGSGKTSVAKALIEALRPDQAVCIPYDDYYKDLSYLTEADRVKVNFDHPDALDEKLLAQHLAALKAGQAVDKPTYDFVHHTRTQTTERVEPVPVIVVEGILTLASPLLVSFFDLKLFVDTDADIRFIRRLKRDIIERGRTLEAVVEQYKETVRPMHLQFVEPSKRVADVIIPEGGQNIAALDLVLKKVKKVVEMPGSEPGSVSVI